jgi:glutaredoxin
MSEDVDYVESQTKPVCPHCEKDLRRIEYRRQKLSFGFMSGATWVIILTCPHCHKVLGTQGWD